MKERAEFHDARVKKKIFPVSTFLAVLVIYGLFTTIQMKIIGESIDYRNIPVRSQIETFVLWILIALAFTLWTNYQIKRYYQKPIEEFSEAAHKVASGDFSVYLAPHHTADKYTRLDVLFTDFNKMVEELGSIETLKTDFFSNVSHEIKTPLAVIQNNAELLRLEGLTEEKSKEYTENILHATKRLSNLITNMLKLNKLEKQTIKIVYDNYKGIDYFSYGFLLKADGKYCTISDRVLKEITKDAPTAADFYEFGSLDIPSSEILVAIDNPQILYWRAGEETQLLKDVVKAYPYPQIIKCMADT